MSLALAGFLLLAARAPAQASLAPIAYLEVSAGPSWEPSINNPGEIVYVTEDESGFQNVCSTRRGQITRSTTGHLRYPELIEDGELFSLEEGQITEFGGLVGFRVDLNDHGEVVFPYRQKKTFIIVLATRYPERYPDFRPPKDESVRQPEFEVAISIDPLGNPGVVVLGSRDLLPVAILTTHSSKGESLDFDVSRVDPLSVRFGPGEADIVVRSMSASQDVDGDGDADLLLFFRRDKPELGCGDTEALLVGRTMDGKAFQGLAPVLVSGCE
ncbi:MAG: hypothetical protein WBP34_11920 [Thermoanaerobaculia bacterium]